MKLDITLNFIELYDLKESMEELEYNCMLTEFFLMGNPCLDWPKCKEYIIAKVPSINRLEGEEVTRAMKLAAKTKLKEMEAELEVLAAEKKTQHEWEKKEGIFKKD